MTRRSIWILGDQLCVNHPALAAGDRKRDRVIMIESRAHGKPLAFHKQKLVLIFSAMRHFAESLRNDGWQVSYIPLEANHDNASGLAHCLSDRAADEVVLMEPNSFGETQEIRAACAAAKVEVRMLPSVMFLVSRAEFSSWAGAKKHLLMENHYRRIRAELDVLIEPDGKPVGGAWNFDSENRKTITQWRAIGPPSPPPAPKGNRDTITEAVIADVERFFPDSPGDADPFWLPVTRAESLVWLERFVADRLTRFGDFQDLMVSDEPTMFHSLISPMINIGLLEPMECVDAAVTAWKNDAAPLPAVEGFVRQILGWREFVNGVYWLRMPEYATVNGLAAHRPLPAFFYTADTDLNCLKRSLQQVIDTGYNHHIQRLMVLGNFLLLADVRPQEALKWFTEMYVDAHDWVMAANVLGMALHADGGFMATKPYAGAGAYISKMSDYCKGCRYKPAVKSGKDACPFNLLYWAFYDRHQDRFVKNPRTSMMVRSWLGRGAEDRAVILREAGEFLKTHVPSK
jgi:deoxyribodipyrimidine photolyase-related protein